jgi:putative transposase
MRTDSFWYTSANFPAEYRELSKWPDVDIEALAPRQRDKFRGSRRAVTAYLGGAAATAAARDGGLSRSPLLRQLNRCVALHPDGRIYGWRALLHYQRVRPYVRVVASNGSVGMAGALRQFMQAHPDVRDTLDQAILTSRTPDSVPESRLAHRAVYNQFVRFCRRAKLRDDEYPFNTSDQGRRALRRYTRERLRQHFAAAARQLGGEDARTRTQIGTGQGPSAVSPVPFEVVSIDAHKLNFIGCIGIPSFEGITHVPIQRFWFIPVIEHASRAVLGYHVAITKEPNASDAVAAVRSTLTVWQQRALRLPGQTYPEGASLPSGAFPQARSLCWGRLMLDNATIHYSKAVADQLRGRLGCAVNYGPVRQWYRRPLIESLFSSLERAGFLRLPNSTGTSPTDRKRPNAASKAVQHVILWEEMLDLVDLVVCAYNATPQESLDGMSPLECMQEHLWSAPTTWLPRPLPPLPPSVPELDVTVLEKTVRGSVENGRRPYVQIDGVRYTNEVLSSAAPLIGKKIRVHVRYSALQNVKAFLSSGAEIGVLAGLGAWGRTAHDRVLRRSILRAIKTRVLTIRPDQDVFQAFLTCKAQQALDQRRNITGRRPRVSAPATELARTVRLTGSPVPTVRRTRDDATSTRVHRLHEVRLPCFLEGIRYRGQSK